MDVYIRKRNWKFGIFIFALLIGLGSMLYTEELVRKMSYEETIKAQSWGEATRILAENASDIFMEYNLSNQEEKYLNDVLTYLNDVITSNETIPLIVVDDSSKITTYRNFGRISEKKLERELEKMKQKCTPIEIYLSETEKQYLYYKESSLLVALRFFPIFQLVAVIVFILVAYLAFSSARAAEQNLVWVGMAKETAHQLGTPISSLIAWIELLKEENVPKPILDDLSKDTERLQEVAQRFSKVGSAPELKPENLYVVLDDSVDYLRKRVSKRIEIRKNFDSDSELIIPLSKSLFGWVIENLVKNSVDAIAESDGLITISVSERKKDVEIEVADNGRGIAKKSKTSIFNPGFTTKKRGWGLGLSLSRRIINNYHKGKIYLKGSEPNVSTVFCIVLRKIPK